jgi:hypothetical protein
MLLSEAARLSSAHQLATGWQIPAHLLSPRPQLFYFNCKNLWFTQHGFCFLPAHILVFFFVNKFHQLCHQDAAAEPPAQL